jgi:flagellar biosynthesis/type III secretory pathway protein FliH
MTRLLKGAVSEARVRSLGVLNAVRGTADPSDPVRDELQAALASLELAQSRIAELEAACIAARREGEAAGLELGRGEARRDGAERLTKLEDGISAALAAFNDTLFATEELASQIAHSCLETIIGDTAQHADLVSRALSQQLKTLEAASVVRVNVSPEDFGEPSALEALASAPGMQVIADDALSGGECRIELRLGSLEIGPVTQWRRLSQVLGGSKDAPA